MRRILTALTLLAVAGALAAGCGGSGGYGSGSASPATTVAPPSTSSGGANYGGGYGAGKSSSSAGTSASGTALTIDNFAFTPASLNVKVGQRVTWTNKQQGVPHTVTADGGAFDHSMPSGATFSFTFTKAGTFAYHCKIHSSMHGTIVVS